MPLIDAAHVIANTNRCNVLTLNDMHVYCKRTGRQSRRNESAKKRYQSDPAYRARKIKAASDSVCRGVGRSESRTLVAPVRGMRHMRQVDSRNATTFTLTTLCPDPKVERYNGNLQALCAMQFLQ